MSDLTEGRRIYHRRSDLFGTIQSVIGDRATVKYEWPYDSSASPRDVPIAELVDSFDAPNGDWQ